MVEVTGEVQAEDFPAEVYRRLQSAVSRLSDASAEESMYCEACGAREDYAVAHEKLLQIQDEFVDSFLLSQDSLLLDRTRLSLMEEFANREEYAEVVEAFVLTDEKIDQSPVGSETLSWRLSPQSDGASPTGDQSVSACPSDAHCAR